MRVFIECGMVGGSLRWDSLNVISLKTYWNRASILRSRPRINFWRRGWGKVCTTFCYRCTCFLWSLTQFFMSAKFQDSYRRQVTKWFQFSRPQRIPVCCYDWHSSNGWPHCTYNNWCLYLLLNTMSLASCRWNAHTGQHWFKHRRLITPTFHFSVLENFCDVFSENANILVEKLNKVSADGEIVNIYPIITKTALDIICGKWSEMTYWMNTIYMISCFSHPQLSPFIYGTTKYYASHASIIQHPYICTSETAMGIKVHAQQQADNEYVESVYRWALFSLVHINLIKIQITCIVNIVCCANRQQQQQKQQQQ